MRVVLCSFAVPIVQYSALAQSAGGGSASTSNGASGGAKAGEIGAVQAVQIQATDYAFLPLPDIKAGQTLFSFLNTGTHPHEMYVARLIPGATPDDFLKATGDPAKRRELTGGAIGILIGMPGNSPDGRLLVSLQKGATYVIACNLRDKPDAPGHLTYGMITSFQAK